MIVYFYVLCSNPFPYFRKVRQNCVMTSESASFVISRNNFKAATENVLRKIKTDCMFSDVTLVCEDNQMVKAHRVILSTNSSVFHQLLGVAMDHPHPLIYLRGLQRITLETDVLGIRSALSLCWTFKLEKSIAELLNLYFSFQFSAIEENHVE